MIYTVSEAAKRLNLTASTLRYYDKEGLLPLVERSSSGIRMFTEADFAWLNLIECLKSTGMPIKDIKQYVVWMLEGNSTLEFRRQMFYDRKSAVVRKLAEMQKTLDTVTYKCWYYDVAVKAGTVDVPKNMTLEDMPPEIRALKKRINTEKE